MPNWCSNNLTISHNDSSKLQEFVDAYNNGQTCEHFMPTPPKDENNNSSMPDWWNWRTNNWGTKWDFGLEKHVDPAKIINNEVSLSFLTAWSPPTGLYQHLYNLGYKITASYFEPGMSFAGYWEDNNDECYQYEDYNDLPLELIQEYNMDEFLEEEN